MPGGITRLIVLRNVMGFLTLHSWRADGAAATAAAMTRVTARAARSGDQRKAVSRISLNKRASSAG